jgi:hypothetical protein
VVGSHGAPGSAAGEAGRVGASGAVDVDDVVGHERGVAADPADEVRAAVVLEALTEHVEAGHTFVSV